MQLAAAGLGGHPDDIERAVVHATAAVDIQRWCRPDDRRGAAATGLRGSAVAAGIRADPDGRRGDLHGRSRERVAPIGGSRDGDPPAGAQVGVRVACRGIPAVAKIIPGDKKVAGAVDHRGGPEVAPAVVDIDRPRPGQAVVGVRDHDRIVGVVGEGIVGGIEATGMRSGASVHRESGLFRGVRRPIDLHRMSPIESFVCRLRNDELRGDRAAIRVEQLVGHIGVVQPAPVVVGHRGVVGVVVRFLIGAR